MRKLSGQAVATLILESWVGPPPEKALPVSEHADNREEKETP